MILLVWNRATHAALQLVEQAYELDSTQVERWPLADDGQLIVKPCKTCDSVILNVDANTRYLTSFRGSRISLAELLNLKTRVGGRESANVYVFYSTENNLVTRLVLDAD